MSYTQVSSTATSTSMDVSRRGGDDESFQRLLEEAKANEEAQRCLEVRKKCELKLVRKYDKSKIQPSRDECWFMVDSNWLNQWAEFVNDPDSEDPPGPVSTKDLLTTADASTDNKRTPLPNLQARIDYRAVPPLVYYIFVELYGRDSSPDICRYSVDIYKPEVPIDKLVTIKLKAVMDAKIAVNRQRPKWMNWEHKYAEDEEEADDGLSWCCGLRKEHIEAFIYWAIRCWSRRSSGRANISYSKYKPLSSTQEMDQSVRLNSGSSAHGGADGSGGEAKGGYSGWWILSSHGKTDLGDDSTHSAKSSGGGDSQNGDDGGLAGWWPFGSSSHGGGLDDSSTHSAKSTASGREVQMVRNALHIGSTHGDSSHGRYSRGSRSNPGSSHGGDEFGDFVSSRDLEDVDVDSSDDDDVFAIAPADQGYESGNWFRTMSGSK